MIRLNRRPRLAVAVPSGRPAALFIDPGYPQVGPIAVAATPGGGAVALRPLPSPWDPVAPSPSQLAALARAAAGQRIPRAADRAWPLTGSLASARVLVAGAGSVGSRIAEDLVRSGVGALAIIDPDPVEAANLSRTVYAAADIGVPKPDALAARLRAIDPAVAVEGHISPLGLTDLDRVLDGISLVIAATDDMAEQALLAHHAYAAGIPLVACALYKAAAAGEVVITVPAAGTACWSLVHTPWSGHWQGACCWDSARAGVTAWAGRSLRARMTPPPPVLAGLRTGDRRTRHRAPVSDRPVVGLLAELSLPL